MERRRRRRPGVGSSGKRATGKFGKWKKEEEVVAEVEDGSQDSEEEEEEGAGNDDRVVEAGKKVPFRSVPRSTVKNGGTDGRKEGKRGKTDRGKG